MLSLFKDKRGLTMISSNSCEVSCLKQDWLFSCCLKDYQEERLCQIADEVTQSLQKEARQKIAEADRNPTIISARKFLKIKRKDARFDKCRKELTAAKLGIESEVLDRNPGFREFAEKNYIERYLMAYGDQLSIDQEKNVSIRSGGKLVKWDEMRRQQQQEQKEVKQKQELPELSAMPKQPWVYGMEGLQEKDMYNWRELAPFKKEDPKNWGGRYVFEFCVICADSLQKTGSHSWIRLKTPEGDVYSVGLYRPGKQGVLDNFNFPLRIKPGYLMQPDVSEFWPTDTMDIYTIEVEISKQNFEKMKTTLEEDKINENQTFHPLQSNCVIFTKRIAKIGEIELPTSVSIFRLLTPKFLEPVVDAINNILPDVVRKVCKIVITFLSNLLQLALGSGKIDSAIAKRNDPLITPLITSFWDLCDADKAVMHHPNTLGHKVRRWVLKWREEETARLEKQKSTEGCDLQLLQQQIDQVNYRIPPNDYPR